MGAAWFNIATAPRDGRCMLLCVEGWQPALGKWFQHPTIAPDGRWLPFDPEGRFPSDAALADHLGESTYEPTHWTPLLAGPGGDVDAPDRLHADLLALPQAQALLKISHWFEDCQQHLDLGREGGLPTAPFRMDEAWIVTRMAANPQGPVVVGMDLSSQPDLTAEITVSRQADGGIEILATQEWFDRKAAAEGDHEVGAGGELIDLLSGPGVGPPIGIITRAPLASSDFKVSSHRIDLTDEAKDRILSEEGLEDEA